MISFRYHVVTVMAVFFALAVGIVLGSGPLRGDVTGTLSGQVSSDKQAGHQLRSEVTGLRSNSVLSDDFARTVAPGLLANTLRGRSVTLVALPTSSQADVNALKGFVATAGGNVTGVMNAGEKLVDPGNKQLVDELGSQLVGRNKAVRVAADASAYERMGDLIARAIGTRTRGGDPVDGTATNILAGLDTAGLLSTQGRLSRRGDLVLFVTGPGKGGADQQRGAAAIVTELVRAVDAGTSGVVLAGPDAAARGNGEVKAVRSDAGTARTVSTVDSVERTDGQVVAVLALAGQAAGRTGQYGAVDAADGAMPGARGSSD